MLLADLYKTPVGISLGVVAGFLLISVIASIIRPKQIESVSAAVNPPIEETKLKSIYKAKDKQ